MSNELDAEFRSELKALIARYVDEKGLRLGILLNFLEAEARATRTELSFAELGNRIIGSEPQR